MSPRASFAMKLTASGVANCAAIVEVALVLAVGRVDDDDHLALRGCPRSPPRRWRTRVAVTLIDVMVEGSSRSTYFASTSTSRLTASPGASVAERRRGERVRDQRDREAVVVERGDRERDAVDRDRALLDAVAEHLRRRVDPDAPAVAPGSTERTRPTPSTWPWTMWPPSGSPRGAPARRSPRRPAARRPSVGAARASRATTSNATGRRRAATTVRQTPSTDDESPSVDAEPVSRDAATAQRRRRRRWPTTRPSSRTMPVNMRHD